MTDTTDGGDLPRLIRRVDRGTLPGVDLVAILDPSINLLIIDKVLFEQLDGRQKELVYRTNETALVIRDGRVIAARLLEEEV